MGQRIVIGKDIEIQYDSDMGDGEYVAYDRATGDVLCTADNAHGVAILTKMTGISKYQMDKCADGGILDVQGYIDGTYFTFHDGAYQEWTPGWLDKRIREVVAQHGIDWPYFVSSPDSDGSEAGLV